MKLEKYDKIEDAEQRAAALLYADRKDKEEVEFTTHKISSDFGSKADPFRYHIETADGNDGVAYMIERGINEGMKHVILYYVSPKDILLYPYRNVKRENFPFLFFLRPNEAICFTRPRVPLSADEALTAEGAKQIYDFFGAEYYNFLRNQIQEVADGAARGEDELFEEEEEEDGGIVLITTRDLSPAILSDFVSMAIHDKESYYKAVEKLLGRSLTDEQRNVLKDGYEFHQTEYFLFYCLYRFITTEQYTDLKAALQDYARFGLPDDWESNEYCTELELGETGEEWVISRYFDAETYKLVMNTPTREIAKFTGIPLNVLQRYSGEMRAKRILKHRLGKTEAKK